MTPSDEYPRLLWEKQHAFLECVRYWQNDRAVSSVNFLCGDIVQTEANNYQFQNLVSQAILC
jgi:hypothetical protein